MDLLVSRATKAYSGQLDSRDLEVSGYAIRYGGVDREGDFFVEGALTAGIKDFLAGSAPLLLNHKPSQQLGKVIELEERDDGVWFKAIIPEVPASSPLYHQFSLIARGLGAAATSIGGYFKKALQPDGRKAIEHVDIIEISLTSTPIDARTTARASFKLIENAVTAEKALVEQEFLDTVLHDLDAIELRLTVLGARQGIASALRRR